MKKIIFSYCRVSTSEQTADGSSGLENQQYINNQAIVRLNSEDEFTRLEDVVEVGSAFKGLNLSNVLESARSGK
jgi:DNA invertase Pin-like site-specific DNA recombinase